MSELISSYLFSLSASKCTPELPPKYIKDGFKGHSSSLVMRVFKLRCFMHNHLPESVDKDWRSEIKAAITNRNMTSVDMVIDYFMKRVATSRDSVQIANIHKLVKGLRELEPVSKMCDICNKCDWSV